jgi:hypothetical protein
LKNSAAAVRARQRDGVAEQESQHSPERPIHSSPVCVVADNYRADGAEQNNDEPDDPFAHSRRTSIILKNAGARVIFSAQPVNHITSGNNIWLIQLRQDLSM